MQVYPIFLNDLHLRRCVVVGGDHEAERKVLGLIEVGARPVVIAASLTPRLGRLRAEERITWIERPYRPGDLDGAFLAVVSVTDSVRTRPIWEEAQARGVLLNAMDDLPHCSFVAGSVVRRGDLVVSISTSGAAPALAVRLRERLEVMLGPEYAALTAFFRRLRAPLARAHPAFAERRRRWYRLADAGLEELLRQGRGFRAREQAAALAGLPLDEIPPLPSASDHENDDGPPPEGRGPSRPADTREGSLRRWRPPG